MIIKATLSRVLIKEELVWHAIYLSKVTGKNTLLPIYSKDIPYLSIDNLKENSSIKISPRHCSLQTGFLFPADAILPQKFIDNNQYHLVAKVIFIKHRIKYETVISQITGIDEKERLLWDEFYLTLDTNFSVGYYSLSKELKTYIETYYKPPIKK